MATDTTMACTRGRRGLQAAAALTVFFFTSQALAQTPAPAPAPVSPVAPAPGAPPTATPPRPPTAPPTATTPRATQPPTATPPRAAAPPTSATPAPGPDDRGLDTEIPQAVEAPPDGTTPPPDGTTPPPTDVGPAPPPEPETPPPPPPPPEAVGPTPPPAPAAANDGNLVVKDQEQAEELRRKGLGVMIAGGVIMVAGAATSIAFTVRGTQYERLLIQTDEAYNRNNCAYKTTDTCAALGKQSADNREGIEFGDRATRAAGAAIAAGVVVTVVGGIIYRLGIKKLRSGDISRVQMTPAIGRGFGGLSLTGRF